MKQISPVLLKEVGWLNSFRAGLPTDGEGTRTFTHDEYEQWRGYMRAKLEDDQELADANQAARWCSDVASQAVADLEPYMKDANRYQWLCDKGYNYHGAMAGTSSMSICRGPYILLEPPSLNKFSNLALGKPAADVIIDAAIAEGKA